MTLELKNITVEFHNPDYLQAVHDVSLLLESRKLYAIVGHNACGKTSLLNAIAGMEGYEYSGSIQINNSRIDKMTRRERAKNIFKIDQNVLDYLVPHFSVYEHLFLSYAATLPNNGSLFRSSRCKKIRATIIKTLADLKVDLTLYFDKPIYKLNGGARQQVALSSLLIRNPNVALLDEPSASLDPENAENCHKLLYTLTLAKSINSVFIIVSHDIPLVCKYSDFIIIMSRGQIVEIVPNPQKDLLPFEIYTKMGVNTH